MAEVKEGDKVDAATAVAQPEELNLWSTLLRESSKKAQNPDTTVIVCGNTQSGKRHLVAKLASSNPRARLLDINDMVSFTFFDLEEGYSESISRVNIWSFGESTRLFEKACEIVTHRSTVNDRFAFVVCVDLSKPEECMMSLVQWLAKISVYIKKYHDKIDPEVSKSIKHSLVKYLSEVRRTKGEVVAEEIIATEEGEEVEEVTEEESIIPKEIIETVSEHFGLPIIVVPCKSDSILPDDGPSVKRARDLQVQLRSICLDIGAALCFTSATQDVNCSLLRQYLTHRLCPEGVPMDLEVEDRVEVTFYPAGFDNEEMIMIAAGSKGLFGTDNIFKAKLRHWLEHPEELSKRIEDESQSALIASGDAESSVAAGSGDGLELGITELEPEQEWLSRLHDFINKVSASGGVGVSKAEETNLVAAPTSPSPMDGGRDGKILGPRKPAVRPTPASGEKKNVGDFFKNLLEAGPAKK